MPKQALVLRKPGALIVPKIDITDVAKLDCAHASLERLVDTDKRDKEGEQFKRKAREIIDEESKIVMRRRGLFSRPEKHYFINQAILDKICERLKAVKREICPEEMYNRLGEINYGDSGDEDSFLEESETGNVKRLEGHLGKVSRAWDTVQTRLDTFLKYFFLTPQNKEMWERYRKEVVPVKLQRSGPFSSEEYVVPFLKRLYEKGRGKSESMQMLPSTLKLEHIDHHVRRVLEGVSDYNEAMRVLNEKLARFMKGEPQLKDDDLRVDIEIINHCLQHFGKRPYTMRTGAFAIQLGTAATRFDEQLHKKLVSLDEQVYEAQKRPGYFTVDPLVTFRFTEHGVRPLIRKEWYATRPVELY